MKMSNQAVDTLIKLVNQAGEDSEKFEDATVSTEPPAYADKLYGSTYELVHFLKQWLSGQHRYEDEVSE